MCTKTKIHSRALTHTDKEGKTTQSGPTNLEYIRADENKAAPWRRGEGGGSAEDQSSSTHEFTEGFGADACRLIKCTFCLCPSPCSLREAALLVHI